jgi:hypothetical protein
MKGIMKVKQIKYLGYRYPKCEKDEKEEATGAKEG